MKKQFLPLLALAIAVLASSCNKLVDEIKKIIDPFEYTTPVITYSLPTTITTDGNEYNPGEQTIDFNIKQILEDNASGVDVGLDDISKISLIEVKLNLEGADEQTNWTNLEYIKAAINTTKGQQEGLNDLAATKMIDDVEEERYNEKVIEFADNNLKDYLSGEDDKAIYNISVKARKALEKDINIKAEIVYSFDP